MRNYAFTPDERPTMSAFNQRFKDIENLANGLGNEYVWEKFSEELLYSEENQDGAFMYFKTTPDEKITYRYGDSFTIDDGGLVQIVNQETTQFSYTNPEGANILKGKYCITMGDTTSLYYIDSTAEFTTSIDGNWYRVAASKRILIRDISKVNVSSGYINSPDQNAYPPTEPDGYTYTLLGQLANLGVKIATGNYSGAGVGGSSSPNTLTFDFEPQILLIATKDGSSVRYFVASRNSEYSFLVSLYDGSPAKCSYSSIITWSEKTVSWYCTADRSYQMNHEGLTYNYIAIG